MNENISHFQSMLDQNPIQFPMLFISVAQDPYDQDNITLNNNQRSQNLDNENFFLASPNPFRNQNRMKEKCQFKSESHNLLKNEFSEAKIQNSEEVYSSQTFFIEQKSSGTLYEQSSTELKDRQSDKRSNQSIKKHRNFKRPKKVKIESQNDFQLQCSQEFQISQFKREGTLKYISEIMYQMIQKHDNLSFAQVTKRLVKYVSNQQTKKGKKISESKIKNIRRRVYDGLNVFIATGIAKKSGKEIRIVEKCKKEDGRRPKQVLIQLKNKQKRKKVDKLNEHIFECQQVLQAKRKTLQQLRQQKKHLKSFFTAKAQTHSLNDPSTMIKFPFVCITTNSLSSCQIYQAQSSKKDRAQENGNSSRDDTYHEGDFVSILFGNEHMLSGIKVEGDVDFVLKMGELYASRSKRM